MHLHNSPTRYGLVARTLHWSSVALVVFLFIDISGIDVAPKLATRTDYVERHVVVGTLLLVVMLVRLWWRWRNPNPVYAYQIGATHRRIALVAHRALYVLVIGIGLAGLSAWSGGIGAMMQLHARLSLLLLAIAALHAVGGVLNQVFVAPQTGAHDADRR